jgi:hypothetical protein
VLTRRAVGRSSPSRLSPPRDRRVQALARRLRGDTIGALNLLHTTAACLDEHTQELARALADIATVAILQQRALASSELLAEQLQAALNVRIVIEHANDLLAERGRLSIDEAFTALGDFRAARIPLTQTARELVTGNNDRDDVLAFRWPTRPQSRRCTSLVDPWRSRACPSRVDSGILPSMRATA